jgi:hypothetical protein
LQRAVLNVKVLKLDIDKRKVRIARLESKLQRDEQDLGGLSELVFAFYNNFRPKEEVLAVTTAARQKLDAVMKDSLLEFDAKATPQQRAAALWLRGQLGDWTSPLAAMVNDIFRKDLHKTDGRHVHFSALTLHTALAVTHVSTAAWGIFADLIHGLPKQRTSRSYTATAKYGEGLDTYALVETFADYFFLQKAAAEASGKPFGPSTYMCELEDDEMKGAAGYGFSVAHGTLQGGPPLSGLQEYIGDCYKHALDDYQDKSKEHKSIWDARNLTGKFAEKKPGLASTHVLGLLLRSVDGKISAPILARGQSDTCPLELYRKVFIVLELLAVIQTYTGIQVIRYIGDNASVNAVSPCTKASKIYAYSVALSGMWSSLV